MISNLNLLKIFSIGMSLFMHGVLIVCAMFGILIFGHLINGVASWIYFLLIYSCCSKGMYVRATFTFLWLIGIVVLWTIIIVMLHFKLWTEILLALIPCDFIFKELVAKAEKKCDRILYLQMTAMIYCSILESVRYLSLLGVLEEEKGYTLEVAKFAAIDFMCIFISKSEIISYIKTQTNWLGKASKTWLLAARITRACVTLTSLTWPFWNIGFDLGRLLLKDDRNRADLAIHIQMLLALNYLPELLSEIALHIYLLCIPSREYKFQRFDFMSSLPSFFFVAAYSMIPGFFIALKIYDD
jgi:hypothetical protein